MKYNNSAFMQQLDAGHSVVHTAEDVLLIFEYIGLFLHTLERELVWDDY